jgi:hypothetical protein
MATFFSIAPTFGALPKQLDHPVNSTASSAGLLAEPRSVEAPHGGRHGEPAARQRATESRSEEAPHAGQDPPPQALIPPWRLHARPASNIPCVQVQPRVGWVESAKTPRILRGAW